jgi:dihydrodipicolinate synthase/N-acetylneuraminate lyase
MASSKFARGGVIPAHPLALTPERKLDERRQRALTRYYLAAGASGVAIGVHTTQFAIRDKLVGLYLPVLEIAAEEMRGRDVLKVAGVVGPTRQAVAEAELARYLGYDAALLGLGALRDATIDELVQHARAIADIIPVFGFYLQPAVGGRVLPHAFWRRFCEIDNVVAIKVAPFNRYQTIDVVRAVVESGRDIALFTGNDDNIVLDLLAPPFVGGLLGHWAVWTQRAVELHQLTRGATLDNAWIRLNHEVTDSNAALFDAANGFHGCIAGIHEILRRQGLLQGRWCLDPAEDLSPGQMEEIDRVCRAYPHLADDDFVREHLDDWLK